MSNSKETNIYHNLVKRGFEDQRPLPHTKKKLENCNWLCVKLDYKTGYFYVCREYKHEFEARKQMDKSLRYCPMFVVEKYIYETFYKPKE